MDREHERAHIELAIERARERMGDTIDELDGRLKGATDIGGMVRDHAPQLMAAGGLVGLVLGLGVSKAMIRMIQIGVPIGIALEIARRSVPTEENQKQAEAEATLDFELDPEAPESRKP